MQHHHHVEHSDHHWKHQHALGNGRAHSHTAHASEGKLFWALLLTAIFLFAEITGGFIASSLALLADAAHMLTDVAALAMALLAVRAVRRPATATMSYGHHRWQVLAAFINGAALVSLSVWILVEALLRMRQPAIVQGGVVMLIAALGLLINGAVFAILSGGEDSLNVRGALAHVLGDLLASAAALLAGALIWWRGWMIADPSLSALVAVLMVRTGWRVARQSAHVLLEGVPPGLDERSIIEAVESGVPTVASVHHVHAWSLSDQKSVVTLHAILHAGAAHDAALLAIHALLKARFSVEHSTIQLEEEDCCAAAGSCV